jgi:hypothetical protein
MDAMKQVISQGHSAIRMVIADPEMKPEEKRQFIDQTYHGMIATSKLGKSILTEARKTLSEPR